MNTALKSAALALVAVLGISAGAQAATVASVDVPLGRFDGLFHEITQPGEYTLDFSGTGIIPGAPDYLGGAGYVFAEVSSLVELLAALGNVDLITIRDGLSVSLGFLDAGVDFAAGIVTLGGRTTMSLNLVDAPAPIPLPASLPLLAGAVGAMGLAARRRRTA